MKQLLVPLFSFALVLTAWAQKTTDMHGLDPVDASTEQSVKALLKLFEHLYNFHQAHVLASFYADDAVWNTPEGQFTGSAEIEKRLDSFHFERSHARDEVITVNEVRSAGAIVIAVGGWTNTVQEDGGEPIALHGWFNVFFG